MRKLYYAILGFAFVIVTSVLTLDVQARGKKLTPEQMHEELEITFQLLRDQHPNFGFYRTEDEVAKSFKIAKEKMQEPIRRAKYFRILLLLVAQIRDGHTCLRASKSTYKKHFNLSFRTLPLVLTFHSEYAVLTQRYKGLKAGTRILSINGNSIAELIKKLGAFTCMDGLVKDAVIHSMNRRFPWLYFLAFGSTKTYQLVVENPDGSKKEISLRGTRSSKTTSKYQKRFSRTKNFLKTSWEESTKTYYISVSSFDVKRKLFEKKIREMFEVIESRNTQNLILDLRNNPGGRQSNSRYLLSYLAKRSFIFPRCDHATGTTLKALAKVKPKELFKKGDPSPIEGANARVALMKKIRLHTKVVPQGILVSNSSTTRAKHAFRGRIHVLINGGTFSAASDLAGYLEEYSNAIFYGSQMGGMPLRNCSLPKYVYELPYSKFELSVAWFCSLRKNNKHAHRLQPDVPFIDTEPDSFKKDRLLALVKQRIEVAMYPAVPKSKPLSISFPNKPLSQLFEDKYGNRNKKRKEPNKLPLRTQTGIPVPTPKPLSLQFKESYRS